MTQSDHAARRSAPHGPTRRDDSTHPANTRPGTCPATERRPYPTASTTTRVSPAKPGSPSARSRSRGTVSTPTPATVWTAGPAPIDLDTNWPTPIVEKIVGAFSEPGGRVALLPWPSAQPTPGDRLRLTPVFSDAVLDHTPGVEPDGEVADALAAVEGLRRTVQVVRVPVEETATGPGSRPFWADLVGTPDGSPATVASPSRSDLPGGVLDDAEGAPPDTDLIITSLRPEDGGNHASDLVALLAARLLRVGGILVVITHCDWPAGELIDPTGAVVACAQNADLLYLQHIIALHAPVREGRFAVESLTALDGTADDEEARAAHRATVRGLPAPHRRVHSDVLVFAQPHQHEPLSVSPAEQAFNTGVIR
ncbi:hypothetical protein [Amycolatopsis sp. H20-H5]|uniref:hypothetical protein n=1 Tax=Amycolatopsis sp. H20-H5 TaxID=3046309 RepID=UPI002DBCEDEC|nr:hypothetical protein [Amycolatopsis sp. H20-H5]MEC3974964.1 hypothetical protein [Amycolatopsis sp. H20-H5]